MIDPTLPRYGTDLVATECVIAHHWPTRFFSWVISESVDYPNRFNGFLRQPNQNL
jgi:hypothetical protein